MDDDAPAILRQLQASAVFDPTLPKRRPVDRAAWARLSEEERYAREMVGLQAIQAAPDYRTIEGFVRALGKRRFEPAVPTLVSLYNECAVVPVRLACGHALRSIGSRDARAALKATLQDADDFSVFIAVRAAFDDDPVGAYEHFLPYFGEDSLSQPAGATIAREVLSTFAPGAFTEAGPLWSAEPRAPAWLREDGRWIALCVRFRRHPVLGAEAREVLRYAERHQVERALADAAKTEASAVPPPRSARDGTLLSRYRNGEHAAVWAELRRHRSISGAFRDEALEVAHETMLRVLHNAELLCGRLESAGWVALGGALRSAPRAGDVDIIRKIELITGASLPPSLQAFWEVVGGIDLVWDYRREDHPPELGVSLKLSELDPLEISSPNVAEDLFEEWADLHDGVPAEIAGPYKLDLAADYLTKADISGGAPYGVELPFLGTDPPFVMEEHRLPFVDYLRLSFRWGGFARLERHAESPEVSAFVQQMTEGFEPF
jgi:hypothetical protein